MRLVVENKMHFDPSGLQRHSIRGRIHFLCPTPPPPLPLCVVVVAFANVSFRHPKQQQQHILLYCTAEELVLE